MLKRTDLLSSLPAAATSLALAVAPTQSVDELRDATSSSQHKDQNNMLTGWVGL